MKTNIEPGMHVRALNCLAPSGVVISVDEDTALVQRNGTAIRPEYVFVWEIEPVKDVVMPSPILPKRHVRTNLSWPTTGRKFQVWEDGTCILHTNNRAKAYRKVQAHDES